MQRSVRVRKWIPTLSSWVVPPGWIGCLSHPDGSWFRIAESTTYVELNRCQTVAWVGFWADFQSPVSLIQELRQCSASAQLFEGNACRNRCFWSYFRKILIALKSSVTSRSHLWRLSSLPAGSLSHWVGSATCGKGRESTRTESVLEKAGLGSGRPAEYPGAAHLSGGVVK